MSENTQTDYSNVRLALIAGGEGTRLWPISNPNCPKQFCQLPTGETFCQATVERFYKLGIRPNNVIVITTNERQRELAIEQLANSTYRVNTPNILMIPKYYGYPGSMYIAAKEVAKTDPNAIVINSPADAFIDTNDGFDNFLQTMRDAISEARFNPTLVGVKIHDEVTFTGCGHALYSADEDGVCKVVHGFVEKPRLEKAREMMKLDESVCNTGINVWRAKTIINAVDRFDFEHEQLGTQQLMDRMGGLRVAIGEFVWKDCGTLKSLWEVTGDLRTPHHRNANLGGGFIDRTDCRRSLFYAPVGIELYATGIKDASVVVQPYNEDLIYVSVVAHDECQMVKELSEHFMSNARILTNDYSLKARNFMIARSNCSHMIRGGCVGMDNIRVGSVKRQDGKIIITVSKDNDDTEQPVA